MPGYSPWGCQESDMTEQLSLFPQSVWLQLVYWVTPPPTPQSCWFGIGSRARGDSAARPGRCANCSATWPTQASRWNGSMCVYRQLLGFRKWTVTSRIQDFSFPSLNAPLVGKTCPTSDFIIKMQREHFIKKCCVNLPYNICALWWFQLAYLFSFV